MQQESLKRVARYLQEQLQAKAQSIPLQVQCAFNKANLMVLVQHPPGTVLDSQQVFLVLEQLITRLPNELIAPILSNINVGTSQIKLFLRILGQPKPYAFHHFEFAAIAPPNPEDDLLTVIQEPVRTDRQSRATVASPDSPQLASPEPGLPEPDRLEPDLPRANREQVRSPVSQPSTSPESTTLPAVSNRKSAIVPARSPAPDPAPSHFNARLWLMVGGGVAAVVLLGGGALVLTRPCVIGECPSLQTAQALSQQSAQTIKSAQSEQVSQQATGQLTEARRLVNEIPPWSRYHGEATALQQSLDQVIEAESQAESAMQKGQAAAQSVTEWQAAQSLWRAAIAQLKTVSQNNPLHTYAQERLISYQANLAFTDQRVAAEQDAQKRLQSAKKTAELAETRRNTAQQLQDWQTAQSTWQMAVNALNQIPNSTTSHAEAQPLLESYLSRLAEVRDRTTKELSASKMYQQAVSSEQRAKTWQQQNQWSQAAASWRNALLYARQVPNGTSYSDRAQTLVTTYTGSLKQAETIVKIRGDMDRVCTAEGKICDYTIKSDAIEVRLTPTYERRVRTLGGLSSFSGDQETMYKINKHLASLGSALQTVCNNASLPIEVYNSDNELIGAFSPGAAM
ncbi:MAG: hypothetical protein HC866_12345 [Leptolyngbyaceae cyanobacterium RU_5_1]|nr:hypothetical protein [Leptolyngbyaceae cyanobacterium RU_5_1]